MLAANIQLLDVYLVDGNLDRITSPAVGEKIGIKAVWQTTDLPADATYQIGYRVNGVQLESSVLTAGADRLSGTYNWRRTGWYADGSVQNVEVIADVFGTVDETVESDNTQTFSFLSSTPDLPQRLIWPLDTAPYSEVGVRNYVDVDPSSGIADYAGGAASYNGHDAFDSGPGNFQYQDEGFRLLAAADGVVMSIHDGEFDRQTEWLDGVTGNHVIIDHGNGWSTKYWHLRRDSVQVEVGQQVNQGDFVGYMGSSGRSTGMHIHFELSHHGRSVEPMYAESDYFKTPFGYSGDARYVYDSRVSNYNFGDQLKEGTSENRVLDQSSGQRSYVHVRFSGIRADDFIEYVWVRPNGEVFGTRSRTQAADYGTSSWWMSKQLPNTPDLGEWRVDIRVNGETLKQEFFEVTAQGAPEIRIEGTESELIVDDRYTPIDFGQTLDFSPDPTKSFTVINHGSMPLILGDIQVPDNYYVVDGLRSSLAPGESDVLTVALDASNPGYHAGEVRIITNDADESVYNFSVEGIVSGGRELILGISERHVPGGKTIVANVRRFRDTGTALNVSLSTDSPAEVLLPSTVTFPAGADYVSFEIKTLSNLLYDDSQITEVYATANGHLDASNELVVNYQGVVRDGGDSSRPDVLETLEFPFGISVEVSSDDFALLDEARGLPVDLSGSQFSYDQNTLTATWDFSELPQPLQPGFYSWALNGFNITDLSSGLSFDIDGNGTPGGVLSQQFYVAIPGDITLDGTVDIFNDGFALLNNLGLNGGASWSDGDVNGDGRVDVFGDGFLLLENLGESVSSSVAAPANFVVAATTESQADAMPEGDEARDIVFATSTAWTDLDKQRKRRMATNRSAGFQRTNESTTEIDAVFQLS